MATATADRIDLNVVKPWQQGVWSRGEYPVGWALGDRARAARSLRYDPVENTVDPRIHNASARRTLLPIAMIEIQSAICDGGNPC